MQSRLSLQMRKRWPCMLKIMVLVLAVNQNIWGSVATVMTIHHIQITQFINNMLMMIINGNIVISHAVAMHVLCKSLSYRQQRRWDFDITHHRNGLLPPSRLSNITTIHHHVSYSPLNTHVPDSCICFWGPVIFVTISSYLLTHFYGVCTL